MSAELAEEAQGMLAEALHAELAEALHAELDAAKARIAELTTPRPIAEAPTDEGATILAFDGEWRQLNRWSDEWRMHLSGHGYIFQPTHFLPLPVSWVGEPVAALDLPAANTQLAGHFLALTPQAREDIAKRLDLLPSDFRELGRIELAKRIFVAAGEGHRLADLWSAVEQAHPEGKPFPNPYAKKSQSPERK
jgi:hypothetical protein